MNRADPVARRIAVCADDFGLHPGIATAAVNLATLGRVSSVTCMTNAPAWKHGASSLRQLQERGIELGLHLDLTAHPLDARLRRAIGTWLLRGAPGGVSRSALRAEIGAQLDRFEAGTGDAPAFVDGHQHVHQFRAVREALVEVLRSRYPGRLPWIRSTLAPRAIADAKARLLPWLGGRRLARLALSEGMAQNAHLLGIYDFAGDGAQYASRLAHWLRHAAENDLLACHPAVDAPAADPIGPARRREFEALSGDPFGALLARERVTIVPLRTILPMRATACESG